MPDKDNNCGGSSVLDFRKWLRHLKPKNIPINSVTWSSKKLTTVEWLLRAARCKGTIPWSSKISSLQMLRSSPASNWTISSEPCEHAIWKAVLLSDSWRKRIWQIISFIRYNFHFVSQAILKVLARRNGFSGIFLRLKDRYQVRGLCKASCTTEPCCWCQCWLVWPSG